MLNAPFTYLFILIWLVPFIIACEITKEEALLGKKCSYKYQLFGEMGH